MEKLQLWAESYAIPDVTFSFWLHTWGLLEKVFEAALASHKVIHFCYHT